MKPARYPFTPEMDAAIRELYGKSGRLTPNNAIDVMQKMTGYPRHIISMRASTLGVVRDLRNPWTIRELATLRQLVNGQRPIQEIAQILHRAKPTVVAQMDRLKLSRRVGYTYERAALLLG